MTDEERELEVIEIANLELECVHEMLKGMERVVKSLADTLAEQDKRRAERREQARLHESYLRSLQTVSGCDQADEEDEQ